MLNDTHNRFRNIPASLMPVIPCILWGRLCLVFLSIRRPVFMKNSRSVSSCFILYLSGFHAINMHCCLLWWFLHVPWQRHFNEHCKALWNWGASPWGSISEASCSEDISCWFLQSTPGLLRVFALFFCFFVRPFLQFTLEPLAERRDILKAF